MADEAAEKDRDAGPGTEPFVPDFDTGGQPLRPMPEFEDGEPSVPFVPDFDTDSQPFVPLAGLLDKQPEQPAKPTAPAEPKPDPKPEPEPAAEADALPEAAAAPVTVPGRYSYLKWWKFVLVLLGVWFGAAQFGLSLYYWWYHTIDKTAPVFVVLVYVVTCTVAGLLLSMVQGRPMITALSLAVMSGPFASLAAAAPLYGYYYCEHATRCLVGVMPY
ncbi:hypothetical protein A5725_07040 [Mycobacterium kubicae]|uniref:hypothetical protein n=1 Tax=Mycobacterium kubicae TaxID=120959 RepID=UPI0008022EC0|nr:hypothetical protein [Mycobacterium kubicae]OBF24355.1 hypothetical protein A5725_07040 [Mycobacterium kubicae]